MRSLIESVAVTVVTFYGATTFGLLGAVLAVAVSFGGVFLSRLAAE